MDNFDLGLQKQEEMLERTYPLILNIYYDYINSDEYNTPSTTQCINTVSRLRAQKVKQLIDENKLEKLEDCCSEAECFREREGFIHGFLYASRLMREIGKV